ncbi:SprT family zinc-dependent metalloprotease [Pseudaestuariivita atlantica]
MTLRVSSLDGRVTLTVPRHVSDREALAFAETRAEWVRGHVERAPGETVVAEEAELPIDGTPHVVRRGDVAAATARDGVLYVPRRSRAVPRAVQAYLKATARDALSEACDRFAAKLGRPYAALSLRDTRSRWGSCTAEGRIMLSWRLIMAPRDVRDYVAAHEVAHLAEMNHSPAFWARVAEIYGPHDRQRAWLRHHGPALHRVRFDL